MIETMGVPFAVRDASRPLEAGFRYRAKIVKPHRDWYERGAGKEKERYARAYKKSDVEFNALFEQRVMGIGFKDSIQIKYDPRSIKVLFKDENDLLRFVSVFDCDIDEVLLPCNQCETSNMKLNNGFNFKVVFDDAASSIVLREWMESIFCFSDKVNYCEEEHALYLNDEDDLELIKMTNNSISHIQYSNKN